MASYRDGALDYTAAGYQPERFKLQKCDFYLKFPPIKQALTAKWCRVLCGAYTELRGVPYVNYDPVSCYRVIYSNTTVHLLNRLNIPAPFSSSVSICFIHLCQRFIPLVWRYSTNASPSRAHTCINKLQEDIAHKRQGTGDCFTTKCCVRVIEVSSGGSLVQWQRPALVPRSVRFEFPPDYRSPSELP